MRVFSFLRLSIYYYLRRGDWRCVSISQTCMNAEIRVQTVMLKSRQERQKFKIETINEMRERKRDELMIDEMRV